MACNWLIRISSHCPNLVRIGCNAKILSRFKVYGVMHDPIGIAFDAKEGLMLCIQTLSQRQILFVSQCVSVCHFEDEMTHDRSPRVQVLWVLVVSLAIASSVL